jgi:endonuclease/exonuclease/phosphatase family metal-dependent hydrolase
VIHVLEYRMRQIRRWLSRSEWSLRLLRVPKAPEGGGERGLLFLQIDGLARTQLEKAIRRGRMPFLRKLLKREGYHLHTVYSGIPSTTAAAQAELFYGIKGAIPAFAYRDRSDGRYMKLIIPECAAILEKQFQEKGKGLLTGGSAYFDIYSGCAAESHVVASGMGAKDILKNAHALGFLAVVIWNFSSLLKLFGLLFLELLLAAWDALRGAVSRWEIPYELRFVFMRVFVCVGLRELMTVMASMDVTRGLPIVHVNFVGYDEQSHRRGPSSKFAHFALRGIDNSIKRLWTAAHRSSRKDYDVWIYSDHGQEHAIPYVREHGRNVEEAVADVLGTPVVGKAGTFRPRRPDEDRRVASHWENWFLGRNGSTVAERPVAPGESAVIAVGPLGHIYLPDPMDPSLRETVARRLVSQADIPIVMIPDGPGKALAFTAQGRFELPADAAKVLGPRHPFPGACAADLAALCHHPHSGDFVIAGWRPEAEPITFVWENGSHGGPGYEETRAFALLPGNAPVTHEAKPMRYSHLREAAMRLLEGEHHPALAYHRRERAGRTLRIMTYNVHGCAGMDGKVSAQRVARVIAHYEPDVVALQECYADRGQVAAIAEELMATYHFPSALPVEQDAYGNAIIGMHPMKRVKCDDLPTLAGRTMETRGALWVAVDFFGAEIQIVNTHLGLFSLERLKQAQALMGPEWLGHGRCAGPAILCGDFNAFPSSTVFRIFAAKLHDAQDNTAGHRPLNTFWGRHPVGRIDHIFCTSDIRALKVEVPRTHLTRLASDHLPIIAELRVGPEAGEEAEEEVDAVEEKL